MPESDTNGTTSGGSKERAPLAAQEYQAVFRASPDGILVADAHGVIHEVNPRLCSLFGYGRDELLGRPVELLMPEAFRAGHRGHREEYMRSPKARPMGIELELQGLRKDGSIVPLEISLSPVETEDGAHVVAIVRDVTNHKRLRAFGAGALRAAEDERRRIARELHDDTAQRLSGLLIRLRLARDADSRGDRDVVLESIREEILESAEGIRRIARGLRPPALEDAGVVAALRSHVRRVRETTTALIEVDCDPVEPFLDDDSRLVLYRIVQEALSNALRHGKPDRVDIRVVRNGRHVTGVVEDDGQGFDPHRALPAGGGLGLLGMRERAGAVGGRVRLDSEPGRGTTVTVEIPVSFDGGNGEDV